MNTILKSMRRAGLMNTKQAAKWLQLCEHTVRTMVAAGELKAIRIGRLIRFRLEDLEDWASKKARAR